MTRCKTHVKLSKKQNCGDKTTLNSDTRQQNLHGFVFSDSRIRSVSRREISDDSAKTVKYAKIDLQENQSTRI